MMFLKISVPKLQKSYLKKYRVVFTKHLAIVLKISGPQLHKVILTQLYKAILKILGLYSQNFL
jgi:hypothetical protein